MLIVYYYIWRSRIEEEKNLLMIALNSSKKDKQGLWMEIELEIKKFKTISKVISLLLISNLRKYWKIILLFLINLHNPIFIHLRWKIIMKNYKIDL
jgi:hypothetical protein